MSAPTNPKAEEAAPDLTKGVRASMRTAVVRCAGLVGHHGGHAAIDVQLIAPKLEKVTPRQARLRQPRLRRRLPVKSASRAASCRNHGYARQAPGPARRRGPTSPSWRMHQATGSFGPPCRGFCITSRPVASIPMISMTMCFARFAVDVHGTCLGSKADQVVRNTARAWLARAGLAFLGPISCTGDERTIIYRTPFFCLASGPDSVA
jgi:hypothetical protein